MKRAQREGRSRRRRAVPLLKQDEDALLRACDADNAHKVMWSRRESANDASLIGRPDRVLGVALDPPRLSFAYGRVALCSSAP